MHTLDDLKVAVADLASVEQAWADYSGNNPDKYQSSLRQARRRVDALTQALKASGALARTDKEALDARLDAAFPNAKSKAVVAFEGRQYLCRYLPAEKSRSGKSVNLWMRFWEEVQSSASPAGR